jgi:hypothetical protein
MKVCEYPSDTCRLARWRVTYCLGTYRLHWIRGFAWPERITKSTKISEKTARAHWDKARDVKGGTAARNPPWKKEKQYAEQPHIR